MKRMKNFLLLPALVAGTPAIGDVVGIDTFDYPEGLIDLCAGGTG